MRVLQNRPQLGILPTAVLLAAFSVCSMAQAGPLEDLIDRVTGREGRASEFNVSLRNRTNQSVWVALSYHWDYHDPESSSFGVEYNPWRADGWWEVKPGQKVYVVDTDNRYIYLYAANQDWEWSGDKRLDLKGQQFSFQQIDLGDEYAEVTINITEDGRTARQQVIDETVTLQAPPARPRNVFTTNGGGRFVRGNGNRWVEYGNNGPQNQFSQTEETADHIDLYDANRRMYVRLGANAGYWRAVDSRQWAMWPGSEGSWSE